MASATVPTSLSMKAARATVLMLQLSIGAEALVLPPTGAHPRGAPMLRDFDPLGLHKPSAQRGPALAAVAPPAVAGLAALAVMQPEAVWAKGGEYGIFEGRIVSLAHPAAMALVYGASAWSAFTGFQWRRLREVGTQVTALKSDLKAVKAGADALLAADETATLPPAQASEMAALQSQIDELTATRKELAEGSFRDKHYQVGSVVLGLGTSFAIEGPVNTFLRAQKLFPGPHLYAGAGIVVCWAMAASLVPLMAKGKDSARNAHIAFNVIALGLFTWQLPTGWEILLKVIKFTKFP